MSSERVKEATKTVAGAETTKPFHFLDLLGGSDLDSGLFSFELAIHTDLRTASKNSFLRPKPSLVPVYTNLNSLVGASPSTKPTNKYVKSVAHYK